MTNSAADIQQNDRSLPIIEANKTIFCMENGDLELHGPLIFAKCRECEFEDEFDGIHELRDYGGIASDAENRIFIVRVSGHFKIDADLYVNLMPGEHRFSIIDAVPAGRRAVLN